MRISRVVATALGAVIVLAPAHAGNAKAAQPTAQKTQRIVIVQEAPTLKVYEPSATNTKVVLFTAPLANAAGAPAGTLTGSLVTVSEGAEAGSARERRLTFTLPKGQLVATGVSLYPNGSVEMEQNKPVTIAIVGGTGRYMGARGEVKTNRNADGTYRHVITLLR